MSISSVLTQIPENTSFMQTTKFVFSIPNLPFMKYFCQSVNMPGVSSLEVTQSNLFSDIYRHGSKLSFDALSITTLIDEDMRVWEETYQWMVSLTNPIKFGEYAKKFPEKYYDGILLINTNSNVSNIKITFRNCHPTSLGSIQFSTSDTPDITPITDIQFRYDVFQIERF